MKIHIISIFPEIFESFLATSIIQKAQQKEILDFDLVNPRDFCKDKYKQIDDEIYGGGSGMLMKAQPIIDAVESVLGKIEGNYLIIFLAPSEVFFDQKKAFDISKYDNLIFVCGRYEGIDFRFEQYLTDKYPNNFIKISIGKYILMGGEVACMVVIESVVRLVSGVLSQAESYEIESYSLGGDMNNLEFPQYTRPEDVCGYGVPKVLLSGNHAKIAKRRNDMSRNID